MFITRQGRRGRPADTNRTTAAGPPPIALVGATQHASDPGHLPAARDRPRGCVARLDSLVGGRVVRGVGIDAARDVLTSTATGMIAFTGLVVSAVLLVVQFAAGQYSPRFVVSFRRDQLVKHAIGSFLAAPLFALVALREIELKRVTYSPDITVVIALALLLGAALLFLALLGPVLDQLRPRNRYRGVARQGIRAARAAYPSPLREAGPGHAPPPTDWRAEAPRELTLRHGAGVVSSFDSDLLLAQRSGPT